MTLGNLVATTVEKQGYDREAAATAIMIRLARSPKLFTEVATPLVEQAVSDLVALACRQHNNQMMANAGQSDKIELGPQTTSRDAFLASMARTNRSWLDQFTLPIPGSPKLGDATKAQLQQAGDFHRGQEAGHRRKLDFFTALVRRVPTGKTVRECLTDEQVDKAAAKIGVDDMLEKAV